MLSLVRFKKISAKKPYLTLGLGVGYLVLCPGVSCSHTTIPKVLIPWSCQSKAGTVEIKAAFFRDRYPVGSDTPKRAAYGFYNELDLEINETLSSASMPDLAFAWSSVQTFNISTTKGILAAPFAGLPIRTEILNLGSTPEIKQLSKLRKPKNISNYFGLSLETTPAFYSQLKASTALLVKDGLQTFTHSTSPFLQTN